MKRKSKGVNFNKITSEVGALTRDTVKSTKVFAKSVSKEISGIKWDKMYKNTQKSLKSTLNDGNKSFDRLMKKYRKTDMYRTLTKDVPKHLTQFSGWSSKQFNKLEKVTTSSFKQSKKWMKKELYPKVESFVRNQMPSSSFRFAR